MRLLAYESCSLDLLVHLTARDLFVKQKNLWVADESSGFYIVKSGDSSLWGESTPSVGCVVSEKMVVGVWCRRDTEHELLQNIRNMGQSNSIRPDPKSSQPSQSG